MEQVIECPCGTVLRAADLGAVIGAAHAHAKEVHDATAMARPA